MLKNKKGFTLIELLAVIIILAVLMLLAVPGILNIMNKSKVNAFRSQAETIYKAAQTQAASEAASGNTVTCYARIDGTSSQAGAEEPLDLSGNTGVDYKVSFDNKGKISSISVWDSKSKYGIKGATSINAIDESTEASITDKDATRTTVIGTTGC